MHTLTDNICGIQFEDMVPEPLVFFLHPVSLFLAGYGLASHCHIIRAGRW
jgi:hypothetical protein